jgi:hypothetical protein
MSKNNFALTSFRNKDILNSCGNLYYIIGNFLHSLPPSALFSFLLTCIKGEVVPVPNLAPSHEDVWGSGGIAPRILDLGTRRR